MVGGDDLMQDGGGGGDDIYVWNFFGLSMMSCLFLPEEGNKSSVLQSK